MAWVQVQKVQKTWVKVPAAQAAAAKGGKGAKGVKGAAKGVPAAKGAKGTQSGKGGYAAKGGKGGKGGSNNSVPASFEVDKEARYTGTVTMYKKFSGFGFIELDQKGVVPNDKLFAYWKSINSDDRFPSLEVGMQVECGIAKVKDSSTGKFQIRAKEVSLPGQAAVALQDEADAAKKEFVGGQYLRYTGTLKFFSPQKGYGYIQIDDGFEVPEDMPKEIRVETSEVNAGSKQPRPMKDLRVEFGIWKTKKGAYKGYNMTLEGGVPMVQESLEGREAVGNRTFKGTVETWNWRFGWGLIKVAPGFPLPGNVMAKIQEVAAAQQAKGKEVSAADRTLYFRKSDIQQGLRLEKDQAVSFKIYVDSKGAGAFDIQ